MRGPRWPLFAHSSLLFTHSSDEEHRCTSCSPCASAWTRNDSLVCVGLDPEPAKFPAHLRDDPDAVFTFCRAIVDATADLVCAFKPQIAHFAALRAEEALERLIAHIHAKHPGVPVILDAKRGDIGSTAQHYVDRGVRSLRRRCGHAQPVHGPRFDPAVPGPRRQGRDPALPHLQPRRRRLPGARLRRPAALPARGRNHRPRLEHARQLRAGHRRHLARGDGPGARAGRRHAAAGARHRRPGRRRRGRAAPGLHGRRHRTDDQFLARHHLRRRGEDFGLHARAAAQALRDTINHLRDR